MKEALKEQTIASRPFKALTEYRLNMPATLVPMLLSTKSQVKINIFTLIQLFSDFEKTCKKRITPTGLTEGERGFEELEAEVDQNVVHKKHDKIERKNLIIANDNLIVDCLKERVLETYDYRSQYDAYEYDTYHANYNIEMEDDTMYR
nr:hypothetical protein [Tanacetum cinerariifolium]